MAKWRRFGSGCFLQQLQGDVPAVPAVAAAMARCPALHPDLPQEPPAASRVMAVTVPQTGNTILLCSLLNTELKPGKPWLIIFCIAWIHWVLLDVAFVLNSMASACAVKMPLVFLLVFLLDAC